MGFYSRLYMNVRLLENTSDDVLGVIQAMMDDTYDVPFKFKESPLVKTRRYGCILQCGYSNMDWLHLTVDTEFKNYDGEIDHFMDFLEDYIADDGLPLKDFLFGLRDTERAIDDLNDSLNYHRYKEENRLTYKDCPVQSNILAMVIDDDSVISFRVMTDGKITTEWV